MIVGAVWRDPALVNLWAGDLPSDRKVIVYCVAGHEISRKTALRLRATGVDARYLSGGFEAWKAKGSSVAMRESR
jgi:superoxide dismutase, Fe-Mn family